VSLQTGKYYAAVMLSAALLTTGCDENQTAESGQSEPVVKTITTASRPFELSADLPGRIEPLRIAQVRARVTGIVLKRHFVEGADVQAGQVLFSVDPAPFRAEAANARGALAKAEAQLYEASAQIKRYEPLVKKNVISRQTYDTALASYRSAVATLDSAKASLETANINLGYAEVRAPISGRIGRALVTEGALVSQTDTTAMATIQQLDNVYADFQQPVADVLNIKNALSKGLLEHGESNTLPVYITLDNSAGQRVGKLLFTDITVDRGTGQVSLRGIFPNQDDVLLPGMYVRVRVGQGIDPKAILVPQRAVHRDLDGKASIMIVSKDGAVEKRYVSTGKMYGSQWHIMNGLENGDKVIVSGSAAEGQKVKSEPYVDESATEKKSAAATIHHADGDA